MKSIISLILFGFLCGCSFATPEGKLIVKITDEAGVPIEGANVIIAFENNERMHRETGLSDKGGIFSASGKTAPHVGYRAYKEGYYQSRQTHMFSALDRSVMRYQPWGKEVTLILRKVKNPVRGKEINRGKGMVKEFPVYDQEIGFDLLEGDWTTPHGSGQKADFIFTISIDKENKIAYYKAEFTNEGDGVQELFLTKPTQESGFRWPHVAPIDGYKASLRKKYIWGGDMNRLPDYGEFQDYETSIKKPLNYIFRIRTQYDEDGTIKSAYYGRITGDIINMRTNRREMLNYWINVDQTSQSLESIDLVEAEERARGR